MSFGSYVRKLRKEADLSLREVANRSGVSHPYLSQLENGKTQNPNPTRKTIKKIANGLNTNYDLLLYAAGYATDDHGRLLDTMFREGVQNFIDTVENLHEGIRASAPDRYNINELLPHVLTGTMFLYNGREMTRDESLLVSSVIAELSQFITGKEGNLTANDMEKIESEFKSLLKRM